MVQYHDVLGSKDTTLHTFDISTEGLVITLSAGEYVNQNEVLIGSEEPTIIEIDQPTETTDYEVWLVEDGVTVLTKTASQEYAELVNPIDRLAWFTISPEQTSLDDIDINFIRMVNA